jgi:hypothetical protein
MGSVTFLIVEEGEWDLVPRERPRAELHDAGLLIEREVRHVYRTRGLQIKYLELKRVQKRLNQQVSNLALSYKLSERAMEMKLISIQTSFKWCTNFGNSRKVEQWTLRVKYSTTRAKEQDVHVIQNHYKNYRQLPSTKEC